MDFILFLFVPIAKLDGEEAGEKIKVRSLYPENILDNDADDAMCRSL